MTSFQAVSREVEPDVIDVHVEFELDGADSRGSGGGGGGGGGGGDDSFPLTVLIDPVIEETTGTREFGTSRFCKDGTIMIEVRVRAHTQTRT